MISLKNWKVKVKANMKHMFTSITFICYNYFFILFVLRRSIVYVNMWSEILQLRAYCDFFRLSFNKLTERHFEKSPWPDADYVASLVDGGQFFQRK